MKRTSLSLQTPSHHSPFQAAASSHPSRIICASPLPRSGFLSLSTADALGWVMLGWERTAGHLVPSLASAGSSASPLSCDNQKYFPRGTSSLDYAGPFVCVSLFLLTRAHTAHAVVTLCFLPLIK